jgi:hypothetical protein
VINVELDVTLSGAVELPRLEVRRPLYVINIGSFLQAFTN